MTEIQQRAYEIVEELRADIDFEIDDVISQIILALPEDYYRVLSRVDQLKHLKALLALRVCDISDEIMIRTDDDRFVAVIARQNYPGMLAKILRKLPTDAPLVGAKIFTSKDFNFIIDLFEFDSGLSTQPTSPSVEYETEQQLQKVAIETGRSIETVKQFVAQFPPESPVFDSMSRLRDQFLSFVEAADSGGNQTVVRLHGDEHCRRLTIASGGAKSLEVFRTTAEYLGERQFEIEGAILNDFVDGAGNHISIASFTLAGHPPESAWSKLVEQLAQQLAASPNQ